MTIYPFFLTFVLYIHAQNVNSADEITTTTTNIDYLNTFPQIFDDQDNNDELEDVSAVFGDTYKEKEETINITNNISSYSILNRFKPETGREGTQHKYFSNEKIVCTDKIVIQQRTSLLEEVRELLPFRTFAVINCKDNSLVSITGVPSYSTMLNLGNDIVRQALVVDAKFVKPNIRISIGDRVVTIQDELSSPNMIASVDFFLNIRDKHHQNLKVGQFSFRFPQYKTAFTDYALTVPFSQNILIQVASLGTKLNINSEIYPQEWLLPAYFQDVFYCGKKRFCNGGPMMGVHGTPYAYQREDYYNDLFTNLQRAITQNKNKDLTYSARSVINQKSQFENHIQETGLFAINPSQCYITNTFEAYGSYVQNELPHELGHTYGLKDYAGDANYDDKLRTYGFNLHNQIVTPWNVNNYFNFRGTMNGGVGDKNQANFTRFNRYSTLYVHEKLRMSNLELPSGFWKNIYKDEFLPSIILTRYENLEYLGFVANIPLELSLLLTSLDSVQDKNNLVTITASPNNKTEKYYTNDDPYIILPWQWFDKQNTVVIEYKNLQKRLYLPYEVHDMPKKPYFANFN